MEKDKTPLDELSQAAEARDLSPDEADAARGGASFIKFDGIEGESLAGNLTGKTGLTSWSWGETNLDTSSPKLAESNPVVWDPNQLK